MKRDVGLKKCFYLYYVPETQCLDTVFGPLYSKPFQLSPWTRESEICRYSAINFKGKVSSVFAIAKQSSAIMQKNAPRCHYIKCSCPILLKSRLFLPHRLPRASSRIRGPQLVFFMRNRLIIS